MPIVTNKIISHGASVKVPLCKSSPRKVNATRFSPTETPQQARIVIIGILTIGLTYLAV